LRRLTLPVVAALALLALAVGGTASSQHQDGLRHVPEEGRLLA